MNQRVNIFKPLNYCNELHPNEIIYDIKALIVKWEKVANWRYGRRLQVPILSYLPFMNSIELGHESENLDCV